MGLPEESDVVHLSLRERFLVLSGSQTPYQNSFEISKDFHCGLARV